MNVENTQVQMRKGILEFCVMHIISRGEVYASDMIEELTSARIMVVEGTLYPLLTRLKNSGLVEYKWVESKSGPPRKYYTMTKDGQKFLDSLNTTWEELIESTQNIAKHKKANNKKTKTEAKKAVKTDKVRSESSKKTTKNKSEKSGSGKTKQPDPGKPESDTAKSTKSETAKPKSKKATTSKTKESK